MSETSTNTSRPRWDAFDHLRGLAAVAVVVLHGAYAYLLQPLAGLIWPVPLDEPNRLADVLFWAIEGCVMPIFFLMSGFFLARSLVRQPPGAVFGGRSRRLLVPMAAIGVPILIVDLWVWGFGLVQMGRVAMDRYLIMKYPREIRADLFGPAHLWYVEYLWLMCAGICLAGWTWQRLRGGSNDRTPSNLASRRMWPALLGMTILSALLGVTLAFEPAVVVGFQNGWLPASPKFVHGLLFLLIGMLLFQSEPLLAGLRSMAPFLLAGAAAAFCLTLPRIHATLRSGNGSDFDLELGVLLAAYALLATGGMLGACLRWLNQPRPLLAALAAASFWIYIVHHPLMGLAHLGLRPLPLPAGGKFILATGGTLAVCLISYRYMVKDGIIGELLKGNWPAGRSQPPAKVTPRETTPRRAA